MYVLEARKPSMFEFEYDGERYSVPSVDSLPFKTFMRIRRKLAESGADAGELGFDEVMGLFEQYVPDVMERLKVDEAKELFVAYASSGTASLGESSPSSD